MDGMPIVSIGGRDIADLTPAECAGLSAFAESFSERSDAGQKLLDDSQKRVAELEHQVAILTSHIDEDWGDDEYTDAEATEGLADDFGGSLGMFMAGAFVGVVATALVAAIATLF